MKKWVDCVTDADRWAYHAEVYAIRRVYLGVAVDEKRSPCDPAGQWHDEFLIRAAATRMVESRLARQREQVEARRSSPEVQDYERRAARGLAFQQQHAAELNRIRGGMRSLGAAARQAMGG